MSLEPLQTDAQGDGPDAGTADAAAWRRVSRKYIVVDVVGYVMSGLVMTGLSFVPWFIFRSPWWIALPVVVGVASLIVIALTPRRVRAIGYQLRADDLVFRRGLAWQRFVAVPYGRMQLVDINRGPLARALGLSELRFVTAAASSTVVIPGITHEEAESLRDQLVSLAESRRAGL
jgi:membrane protein YdbS with pleckstrin-like domain